MVKEDVVKLADPVTSSFIETEGVPLSVNVTDPVGIPEVDAITMAVNVTGWPGAAGFGAEFIEMLVFAGITVWMIVAEVLETKLVSP